MRRSSVLPLGSGIAIKAKGWIPLADASSDIWRLLTFGQISPERFWLKAWPDWTVDHSDKDADNVDFCARVVWDMLSRLDRIAFLPTGAVSRNDLTEESDAEQARRILERPGRGTANRFLNIWDGQIGTGISSHPVRKASGQAFDHVVLDEATRRAVFRDLLDHHVLLCEDQFVKAGRAMMLWPVTSREHDEQAMTADALGFATARKNSGEAVTRQDIHDQVARGRGILPKSRAFDRVWKAVTQVHPDLKTGGRRKGSVKKSRAIAESW